MLLTLLLAAITPLAAAATPAPTTSDTLPEIGRVRANTLCTTLRSNIAPTIMGFMKNDEIIGAGHRAFAKMGHDAGGTSSAQVDIDKLYLEQIQTRLVHNLKVVATLLNDPKRFPAIPASADERAALTMRAQLLTVADSQKQALDLISGTLDSENLGQMQADLPSGIRDSTGAVKPLPAATSDPVSFLGTAGLPEYEPVKGLPTTADKASSTVIGHTVYDTINTQLEATQTATERHELMATNAVVDAVNACKANAATPQPSPAP